MPEQPDVTNVTATLTEPAQFGATKIANFLALSAVFRAGSAKLTGNPPSVLHRPRHNPVHGGKLKATTMAWASLGKARFGGRHVAMIAALSIPMGLSTTYAMSIHAAANSRLQEVADNAALAGVNALAINSDQPADVRSQAAIAAARAAAIVTPSGVVRTLSPSGDGLTMSVTMEDMDKGTRVSATAHYIPPKDARPSQEAANWMGSSNPVAARL